MFVIVYTIVVHLFLKEVSYVHLRCIYLNKMQQQ